MFSRLVQFSNASLPTFFIPAGRVTWRSSLHSAKQALGISVTPLGTSNSTRDLQPLNRAEDNFVVPSAKLMVVRLEQFSNNSAGSSVILDGRVISVRLVHPSKAEAPILVMQLGISMEVRAGLSLKAPDDISSTYRVTLSTTIFSGIARSPT